RRMHAAGCRVAINHPGPAQTARDAERLAGELNARRADSAAVLAADVSREEDVAEMMRAVRARFGRLDHLINNAGVARDRTLAKMSLEEWRTVMDVNLTGVFLCCRHGQEILRDGGTIVSLSSCSAQIGLFGQGNYAAAKA